MLINGEITMLWNRPIFNVVAVRGEFAREHPDVVRHVLGVRALMDEYRVPIYSDHLTYCAAEGHLYDLLPLPFILWAAASS